MPFQPMPQLPPPTPGSAVVVYQPQPQTQVSQPQAVEAPRRKRRRRWPKVLLFVVLFILFEPVRIALCVLFVFWVLAIGIMPHVAAFKVITGTHK